MAFDFKKEYKEFYLPPKKPVIVTVPAAKYVAIRGKGDPNAADGAYKDAIGILYGLAFTIKMSYKGDHKIDGFFEFAVPPLEGFWWQEGVDGVDYTNKDLFNWISVIRMPDFVTKAEFDWAMSEVQRKKKVDCSKAELVELDEGVCVQIMHIGAYDDEPASVALMDAYIAEQGYKNDFSNGRMHHEIYLSDARRVEPARCKTVIRHPIAKI